MFSYITNYLKANCLHPKQLYLQLKYVCSNKLYHHIYSKGNGMGVGDGAGMKEIVMHMFILLYCSYSYRRLLANYAIFTGLF